MYIRRIKNFSLIAHIDHGKSTLSKLILQYYNIKSDKIDFLTTEKIRGITIKSKIFTFLNKDIIFNLIDTPGHISFKSEVERSIYISDLIFLLIDIQSGLQSQTIKYYNLCQQKNKTIIPVLTKIDLLKEKNININNIIENIFLLFKKKVNILKVSKNNIKEVINFLENYNYKKIFIDDDIKSEFYAFDSFFHQYIGTIIYIKVIKGNIKQNDIIYINKEKYIIYKIGIFFNKIETLYKDDIGYIIIKKNIYLNNMFFIFDKVKNNNKIFIFNRSNQEIKYKNALVNIFPKYKNNFNGLLNAIKNLNLTDPGFDYKIIKSFLFGQGIRIQCNDYFHLDIIKDRLYNEYKTEIDIDYKIVDFKITTIDKKIKFIDDANDFPIKFFKCEELFCKLNVYSNIIFLKSLYDFFFKEKAILLKEKILNNIIVLSFKVSFRFIINKLSDYLYSITKGNANFYYEILNYDNADVGKITVYINKNLITGLTFIIDKFKVNKFVDNLVEILKTKIKRKIILLHIQIKFNNKIIRSLKIKPIGKIINIKSKGDYNRVLKLFKRRSEGKKKLLDKINISISNNVIKDISKNIKY